MAHYIIYFNQLWVGDHTEVWFQSRGPLARAVVAEMREAGVLVFAAGVDEDLSKAFSADATSGELHLGEGRYSNASEYLGGFTVSPRPRHRKVLGRQDRNGLWLAARGQATRCLAVPGAFAGVLYAHCYTTVAYMGSMTAPGQTLPSTRQWWYVRCTSKNRSGTASA